MLCPKCGAQLPDDSAFCTACGSPIPSPNAGNAQPSFAVKQPQKRKMKPALIAALCAISVIAAAAILFLVVFKPKQKSTPSPASTAQTITKFWTKEVTYRQTPVPQAAYAKGAERCSGMGPDGHTFLMTHGTAPYLYSDREGKDAYLPLRPANDTTKDQLWELVMISLTFQAKTEDERDALVERYHVFDQAAVSDEELVQNYLLLMNRGTMIGPQAKSVGESFLFAADASGLPWIIDCETGKFTMMDTMPAGERNGRILYVASPLACEAKLLDWKTGEETAIAFPFAKSFTENPIMTAAGFLPDGGFCAILSESLFSTSEEKTGTALVLALRDTAGHEETYDLGKINAQGFSSYDRILTAGNDCILVYSSQLSAGLVPYLIDRRDGSVSQLAVSGDGTIRKVPLTDCLDADGVAAVPEGYKPLLPLDVFNDGVTLLFYDASALTLSMYRPETGETRPLLSDRITCPIPFTFCSDHNGRIWATSTSSSGVFSFDTYYQLTAGEKDRVGG